jgi:hypothetical protein
MYNYVDHLNGTIWIRLPSFRCPINSSGPHQDLFRPGAVVNMWAPPLPLWRALASLKKFFATKDAAW